MAGIIGKRRTFNVIGGMIEAVKADIIFALVKTAVVGVKGYPFTLAPFSKFAKLRCMVL